MLMCNADRSAPQTRPLHVQSCDTSPRCQSKHVSLSPSTLQGLKLMHLAPTLWPTPWFQLNSSCLSHCSFWHVNCNWLGLALLGFSLMCMSSRWFNELKGRIQASTASTDVYNVHLKEKESVGRRAGGFKHFTELCMSFSSWSPLVYQQSSQLGRRTRTWQHRLGLSKLYVIWGKFSLKTSIRVVFFYAKFYAQKLPVQATTHPSVHSGAMFWHNVKNHQILCFGAGPFSRNDSPKKRSGKERKGKFNESPPEMNH